MKHRMTALCPPVAEKGGESGGEKGVRKIYERKEKKELRAQYLWYLLPIYYYYLQTPQKYDNN